MRYAITIQYLGTNYCGWQVQPNGESIQSVLENALSDLFKNQTTIYGSGRTDAGVHALGQVAHFDAETTIPAEKIPYAVNVLLPNDIRVVKCEEVSDDFHARYYVKQKTYVYKMYESNHINPLKNQTAYHISCKLDIEEMKKACKFILGEHDFKCFSSTGSSVKDTIRTIYDIGVNQLKDDIFITVTGSGFLYNMVRIIAGTLIDVGKDKIKAEDIPQIILSGDRKLTGKTLPPNGLCLKEVRYT